MSQSKTQVNKQATLNVFGLYFKTIVAIYGSVCFDFNLCPLYGSF